MDLIKDLFKGDKVIWIIFLFLCLISIVEVFSAASTLTYKSGDHWGPITQHSVILMVGACIVVLVHNIPCKWFRVLPFFLLPISAVLLVFVMGMGIITGDRVNGAARWMTFSASSFNRPSLQNGCYYRYCFHSFQVSGRRRRQPEGIQIYHVDYRYRIHIDCSRERFNSHVTVWSRFSDDDYRSRTMEATSQADFYRRSHCRHIYRNDYGNTRKAIS